MPRRAGPRDPLTRDRILGAALTLVDEEGVERLTMRRLGERLGVDAMAVYYHVPSKAHLHDGLVERVWAGVIMPEPRPGESWQDLAVGVFTALRERLLEHPRVVMLAGTRSASTPATMRLVDETLARLVSAGLPAGDAMVLVDCLAGYTIGKVMGELGAGAQEGSTATDALGSVTPGDFPHLFSALSQGYEHAPEAQFDRGLRALVDGWPVRPIAP